MLGMAITAYTPTGTPAGSDEAGELVCERPFPCMPVGFWPLAGFGTDEEVKKAEERFRDAYFPEVGGVRGVWCQCRSLLSLVLEKGLTVFVCWVA